MATDTEAKQAALNEFGLAADTTVTGLVDIWWNFYSDKTQFVKYLYLKARLVSYLIFKSYKRVDIVSGFDEVKLSQQGRNLAVLLKAIMDEIKSLDPYAEVAEMQSVQGITQLPFAVAEVLEQSDLVWGYYFGGVVRS